jgi:hypothetical protein
MARTVTPSERETSSEVIRRSIQQHRVEKIGDAQMSLFE